MRKLRGREVDYFTQGDMASYWSEKEFKLWFSDARQTQWFSDLSKNVQLKMDEQDLNQALSASITIRLK